MRELDIDFIVGIMVSPGFLSKPCNLLYKVFERVTYTTFLHDFLFEGYSKNYMWSKSSNGKKLY